MLLLSVEIINIPQIMSITARVLCIRRKAGFCSCRTRCDGCADNHRNGRIYSGQSWRSSAAFRHDAGIHPFARIWRRIGSVAGSGKRPVASLVCGERCRIGSGSGWLGFVEPSLINLALRPNRPRLDNRSRMINGAFQHNHLEWWVSGYADCPGGFGH